MIYLQCGSMKLDGTNKRKVKEPKFTWKKESPTCIDYDHLSKKVTSGNYCYYVKSNCIMCKNKKTGRVSTLFRCDDGVSINDCYVHKQHVFFSAFDTDAYYYYYVRSDGKKLKKLSETEEDW